MRPLQGAAETRLHESLIPFSDRAALLAAGGSEIQRPPSAGELRAVCSKYCLYSMHGDACRQHFADVHAASAGRRPQNTSRTSEHAAVAAAGGTENTRALSAGEPPVTSKRSMPRNRSRLFNQSTGEGDSLQNAINAFQVGQGGMSGCAALDCMLVMM